MFRAGRVEKAGSETQPTNLSSGAKTPDHFAMKPPLLNREPLGEGGGTAAADAGAPNVPGAAQRLPDSYTMPAEVMADVFAHLDLPEELRGAPVLTKTKTKSTTSAAPGNPAAVIDAAGESAEDLEKTETARRAALTTEDLAAEDAEATRRAGLSEAEREAEDAGAATAGTEDEDEDEEEGKLAQVSGELTTAKTELASATERVKALEAQLTTAKAQPVAIANIAPVLLEDDPAKVQAADANLARFEQWALANWDGVEAREAAGNQPAQAEIPKDVIRAKYAAVLEERKTLIPLAAKLQQSRAAWDLEVKKVYPKLFDEKSPEYAIAQNIIAQAPALKALFPNWKLVIGDAIEGERARKAKAAAGKAAVKAAPKVPGKVKSAAAKPVVAAKRADFAISTEDFNAMGGDQRALVALLNRTQLPVSKS